LVRLNGGFESWFFPQTKMPLKKEAYVKTKVVF
jgi:hypothetical protein